VRNVRKLKKKQINTNPNTLRPENIKVDIDQPRHSKCLEYVSQEIETRSPFSSEIHKENNLMLGLSNIKITLPQFDVSCFI
jgi:hypothetical protein